MLRSTAILAFLATLGCLFWLSSAAPVASLTHWTDRCDGTLNPNIVPNPQLFYACMPDPSGSTAYTCDGTLAKSVSYSSSDCTGPRTAASQTLANRCLNFGNGVFQRWNCLAPPPPVSPPVPAPVAPVTVVAPPPTALVAYLTYWTNCDVTLNTAITPNPKPIYACMAGNPVSPAGTGSTSYSCTGSSLNFSYFPTSDCSGPQCAVSGSCGGYGLVGVCTGTNGNWQKYTCA